MMPPSSCRQHPPGHPERCAAERPVSTMQRFLDKWFLPIAFVVIGCVITYGLWQGIVNRH
jgi:hypothetical protein